MTVYLDNSATTKPSEGVIRVVNLALSEGFYNPSAMYEPALAVEKRLNECREEILSALGARDASVLFTSGGTESNNLALAGTIALQRAPVRMAVSAVEHPSVFEAAQAHVKGRGEVVLLPVTGEGSLDMEAAEQALRGGLTLLSAMQVTNETGAVNDIPALVRLRDRLCPECRLHVDGVQGFLREEIAFKGIDLYTLSAHKLHALKGTGALVMRKGLRLAPLNVGGGQENGLRSGTENTIGILALGEAISEMRQKPDRRAYIMKLKTTLFERIMAEIPNALLNGPAPEKGACHILNMSFPGVRGETILHALEEKGVYVSTGSACSARRNKGSRVLSAMGISPERALSALRFSLSPYNTTEEIDYAVRVLKDAYAQLVKYQRR